MISAAPRQSTFYQLLTEAVADFAEHGYDSELRLEDWLRRLRAAAQAEMVPLPVAEDRVREALAAIYRRLVERAAILRHHPGAQRFTLARVAPRLRSELDRRILASTNLIRLNREEAVEKTLRRFSGWATSIPTGGSGAVDRVTVKSDVRRGVAGLPFTERRVAIDQGHKLAANLSEVLAVDGGALAGRWHRHHTRYPREEHRRREGRVYAVRGNWALERGLMKVGPDGYTDEIERPSEFPLCRCTYEYLHSLRLLPDGMLTEKGRAELDRVMRAA